MHGQDLTFDPISDLDQFDSRSGRPLERALFNNRLIIVLMCLVATMLLGSQLGKVRLNASYEKSIPAHHPFVLNYFKYGKALKGLTNAIRVAVEVDKSADIFDADYIDTLRHINDEIYLLPFVDRPYMKSLWMPAVRWLAVTQDGYEGGPVMPGNYDRSAGSISALRANILRSGEVGKLVAPDFRSSVIYVPLLESDPKTGEALDYGKLSAVLDEIRDRYQADGVKIHITGFAKVMGDLIDGLKSILVFFALTIAITGAILFYFTRCLRSTILVLSCTLVGIVWMLGLLPLLGYELNPYSILVPFLVFAIGVSHGAQKMNGIMQDIGRGTHKLIAARYTFRRLFAAGAAALMADVTGFAILSMIDIPVIRDLALIASIGVGILIFTNLALLPILLSYSGVSPKAAARSLRSEQRALSESHDKHPLWKFLDQFTKYQYAAIALVIAGTLGAGAYMIRQDLKIGDLDRGAPELWPNSRYNQDNDFLVSNYRASSDIFVIMVDTKPGTCVDYETLESVDRLEWSLRQLPGVEGTESFSSLARRVAVGFNEGNPKWYDLVRNQGLINGGAARAPRELFNPTCDLLSVYAYLKDHKADTLKRVVREVEHFAAANNTANATFLLAAGNSGVEAATNIVVEEANGKMLIGVFAAVILLCAIAFRSWRAVVCAVLPLALTSIMAEALMVILDLGVKVATLPVIALGVGIGVDYALYIMSVLLASMRSGMSLSDSYYRTLLFTGRVVVFTGFTLSLGVITWAFSPIKFQADMGVLLTFMFLWNMLGALILIPSLARFLMPSRAMIRERGETVATHNDEKVIHG